jgi:N-glycosylase/DNA lyase
MTNNWSDWQYYQDWHPDLDSFIETLDGGQAFCWEATDEQTYEGVVAHIPYRVRWQKPNKISWSTHPLLFDEADALFGRYIGKEDTYRRYYDTLPWRSDPHLETCMARFPALRILNQPSNETLLGFLCSATKQIVQIKEMLCLVRERFGSEISGSQKSLPTWDQLYHIEETALRECKFGFRAKNIKKTADILHKDPTLLNQVVSKDYETAKATLCTLPGVGEKIADCTLLFGYQKLEAFPVDTWILKAMQRRYQLDDWNAKQVSHFGRIHFGSYAGLAQQFIFSWERKAGRK